MNGYPIKRAIRLRFTPELPDTLFSVWDSIAWSWYSGMSIY